jgi:hypothetical protein
VDITVRPDRSLEQVFAGPDASSSSSPRRPTRPKVSGMTAKFLTFRFDAAGARSEEVQAQKDAVFEGTPIAPSKRRPAS